MNHQELSQKTLQGFKKGVKKKISALRTTTDLKRYLSKFNTQKKTLEKKVKKTIETEIKNATKFLGARQKELNAFHKKVNLTIKRKIKRTNMYS